MVSLAAYLGKFFYPVGSDRTLSGIRGSLPAWEVAVAAAVLAVITAGVDRLPAKRPYLLVGWLWYLGMLVPVIGLVQVGSQAMADRYTYLPMIGVTIALAWLLASLAKAWRWGGVVLGLAGAVAAAVLMGCAWQQTSYWQDKDTLEPRLDTTIAFPWPRTTWAHGGWNGENSVWPSPVTGRPWKSTPPISRR